MNYIKQLQEAQQETLKNIESVKEEINNFLHYLNSNKFYTDTTIQSKEVYTRLLEIRNIL
jgi:hypothetical protein